MFSCSCTTLSKRHKIIEANDCMEFRCIDEGKYSLCDHCTRGSLV